MKLENKLGVLLLLFFSFILFRFFFSDAPFVAHDWPLLFRESREFNPFWAMAWDYMGSGGLGGSAFKTLWIDLYANFVYAISNFINIPWWLSQRIFWILPFVLLSIFSSYKFSGLFIKDTFFRSLSVIIYTFNTYILLVVGGGQFGVSFAYAVSPLVLFFLFRFFNQTNANNLILSGFISGLLIALDPRIALLTFGIAFVWYLILIKDFSIKKIGKIVFSFTIAILLNSYWIVPIVFEVLNSSFSSSVQSYTSVSGAKFLSFASLSNSISLLHPNWPENIFGKIYFMRPEFLLIPFFAFGAFLFKVKKEILFFVGLSLLGIFLGKGANEPFGQVYLFLFEQVPGFSLFRDPTKFYLLIALSYGILIPIFIENLSIKFAKYKFLITGMFIVYFLFILKPAWSGELTGVFDPKPIPQEYQQLAQFLKQDKEFSRTLWVPKRQKYGFFNPNHPAIDSEVLFKKRDVSSVSTQEFADLSIKYIIVPSDLDSEIFLKDRKYDDKKYKDAINKVEKSLELNRIDGFGKLAVYVNSNSSSSSSRRRLAESKDHFWCDCDAKISYEFINPTSYKVTVQNANKGDILVFSEGFDKNWIAENLASQGETFRGQSSKFGNNLNSFVLPEDGNYELKIYYEPQKWVNVGLLITASTLLVTVFLVLNLAKKGRK